jgi:hypothetical protein
LLNFIFQLHACVLYFGRIDLTLSYLVGKEICIFHISLCLNMNGLDLFWYKNLNVFLACNNDTVDACDVSRCPLFLIGVEGYG